MHDDKMTFADLPLTDKILKPLQKLGYETPTEIQANVIPEVLKQRDVCGVAQTGSGKTGSYTIPVIEKLAHSRARHRLPRCLVLVPTRELAQQVHEAFQSFAPEYPHLKSGIVIGGASMILQERLLRSGIDFLIATPGRLMDHFERGNIVFSNISTVIIDEADRMLDMGFIPDIEAIMQYIDVSNTQILCFSATMPKPVEKLLNRMLKDPYNVQFETKHQPKDDIQQIFVSNPGFDRVKRSALRVLLDREKINQAIIFCNRKRDVAMLTRSLCRYDYKARELHGDLSQNMRMETLEDFKAGKFDYLVASDIAARGIDIDTLPYVINFDVPTHPEEYVHRIGRTGRAGKKGKAITFISPEQQKLFQRLEEFLPRKRFMIDAEKDLTIDPFYEMGYRKPNLQVKNFTFSPEPQTGFGPITPDFMDISLSV